MDEVTTEFFPDFDSESDSEPAIGAWSTAKLGTLQSRIEPLSRWRGKIPLRVLVEIANSTFGYNGWSTQIANVSVESQDAADSCDVVCVAHVRIILQDGCSSIFEGRGQSRGSSKCVAYSTAKKSAIGDATRNAILGLPHLAYKQN